MQLNINETVRVKLTQRGRDVHRLDHINFWSQFPGQKREYRPPIEDAEGWSSWQLWCLMKEFGPHTDLGMSPCFETIIEIPPPKEQA